MNTRTIFQILFLVAACFGLFGVVTKKEWGPGLGLIGLILFDLVLLIP